MKDDLKNNFWDLNETVGQHFIDLMASLLAMVIVARNLDLSGFGNFSYLVALFHIASFVSEAGICDRFKNNYSFEKKRKQNLKDAAGALFLTGIFSLLFFFFLTIYDTSTSHIEERILAYFFIAIAVPLRNGNRLRTTLLHVSGTHRPASRILMKKHIFFLVIIGVFSLINIPELLAAAFLFSEIFQRLALRKRVKIPSLFQSSYFARAFQTIRQSLQHLFSGQALNLIFHTDIFILGLFTTSSQLGIYAEAALFSRFFLLIPVGARPILHRNFVKLSADGEAQKFSKSVFTNRAYMFYIHALLAIFLTIFFDDTIHFILGIYGSELISHYLFSIMLPGFLFYAAVIVSESALEAAGHAPFLSRISAAVICLNVFLNFYLIPFAGVTGAATSTLLCLLVYFFTICTVKITVFTRISVFEFLSAGAVVYLFTWLAAWTDFPLILFIFVVPPLLHLILYLLNFFDFNDYHVTKNLADNQTSDSLNF